MFWIIIYLFTSEKQDERENIIPNDIKLLILKIILILMVIDFYFFQKILFVQAAGCFEL
jgi:hypothetical protein